MAVRKTVLLLLLLAVSVVAQQHLDDFDADEFELPETVSVQHQQTVEPAQGTAAPDAVEPPLPRTAKPIGVLEGVFAGVIGFYVLMFFIGMTTNRNKARGWFSRFRPLFEKQFVVLGKLDIQSSETSPDVAPESVNTSTINKIDQIEMESFSRYVIAATGRRNCLGARIAVELKNRQDLISSAMSLFSGEQDTLTIDFFLTTAAQCVFCVCAPKMEKKMREGHVDLNTYAIRADVPDLDNLVVLAECPSETVPFFIGSQHKSVLQRCGHLLLEVHITDQKTIFATHNQILRAEFKMPQAEDYENFGDLLQLLFDWLDMAVVMKNVMPKTSLAKLSASRTENKAKEDKLNHKERQEAAMKRREEKLTAERDALPSAAARAKFDEKLKKKERKAKVKVIKY